MDVVIVGIGRIGLVAACCLASSGHQVTGIEIDKAKLKLLNSGISPNFYEPSIEGLLRGGLSSGKLAFSPALPAHLKADAIIITVNTPPLDSGEADLSQVYSTLAQVRDTVKDPLIILMKSTVPPGTGVRLKKDYLERTPVTYVANPEFLRTDQAIHDWYHPSRIVVGTDSEQAIEKIRHLYSDIEAPVLVTDITSAEIIKYAANNFLATKISFINETANLCEILGGNIDDVIQGVGLDPRIGTAFLQPGVGYGGPCLPKDARALDYLASKKGFDYRLMKAAIEVNNRQRILTVQKLKQLLGSLDGKEVAVLGLAFKPGSDDVTEAPSLDIVIRLVAEGAKLRVYDPMAMENAKPLLPSNIVFAPDIYSATTGSNGAVLVTEWQEFIEADWQAIKKKMIEPYAVVDGRNALPRDRLVAAGFKYVGVGRGLS